MGQNYGSVKISAPPSGALTVAFIQPSGQTPALFSDAAVTTPTTSPYTVPAGTTVRVYVASRASLTMSVILAGRQVADPNLRATVPVELDAGVVATFDYSALVPPANSNPIILTGTNLLTACGDSISNNMGQLDPVNPATTQWWSTRGWAFWANAVAGWRFGWVSPGTTGAGSIADGASGIGFCKTGMRTTDVISSYAPAAAGSAANVVLVHVGTNDCSDGTAAAVIAANIQIIWRVLTAAGKQVIATTLMPRDSSVLTGSKLVALNATNVLIRQMAAVEPNVYLCDWAAALLDSAGAAPSNGSASAFTADGLHPNATGAMRLGSILAPILVNLTSAGVPADHLPIVGADLLTPNPYATGNVSGVATSWTLTNVGSPTSVIPTKVARTDLLPGQWQQVVIAAATASTDGFTLQVTDSNAGTDFTTGDTVYACVELQADASGWDCRGLQLDVVLSGTTVVSSAGLITSTDRVALTQAIAPTWAGSLVMVTPRVVLPAGVTAVRAVLRFFGSGTIRVARMGVRKV